MSVRSWLIVILALAVLFPFHAAADELPASESEETVVDDIPVAPFDFGLLEESAVQAVERLEQVIQILSGLLFFLGMCAGMLFFKVLADRVRSV